MKRFKTGQQVVAARPFKVHKCRDENGTYFKVTVPIPKLHEIVTVKKYSTVHPNHIELVEYQACPNGFALPMCFDQGYFEPLMDISELTEILEQQPEHA